jgi:hypothetical protein
VIKECGENRDDHFHDVALMTWESGVGNHV